MSTEHLEFLHQQRRQQREAERQRLLAETLHWLNIHGVEFGIQRAYLFGSITRPGHFHETSDIDIAVEQIDPRRYFEAIGTLSEVLGREVDLIELTHCPFQHRIGEVGFLWTAAPDSSLPPT